MRDLDNRLSGLVALAISIALPIVLLIAAAAPRVRY
jgi:hypothetical protein